jgi:hypothetical protein
MLILTLMTRSGYSELRNHYCRTLSTTIELTIERKVAKFIIGTFVTEHYNFNTIGLVSRN